MATSCVDGSTVGQNVAAYGNTTHTPVDVITAHVDLWAVESIFYDPVTDSCSNVCRHYKQIVSADTAKVSDVILIIYISTGL